MTPTEEATALAEGDLQRHSAYGVDLNPYSTQGSRDSWQRGFTGAGPRSWEAVQVVSYCLQYQRGAAAARLVKSNQEKHV